MPTTSWLCGGILNNANKVKFLLHVLSTLGEKGGRIWHSENCDGLSYLHPLFAWFLFCLFASFLLAQSCDYNEYFIRISVHQSSPFAICSKSAQTHCRTYGTSKTTRTECYTDRIFCTHFLFRTQKDTVQSM